MQERARHQMRMFKALSLAAVLALSLLPAANAEVPATFSFSGAGYGIGVVSSWCRDGVVMVTVSMMVPPGLAMREQQPTEQQGAFKPPRRYDSAPSPQRPPPPRYASPPHTQVAPSVRWNGGERQPNARAGAVC